MGLVLSTALFYPLASCFQEKDSHFPLVPGKNLSVGDVETDDGVSLVDTWKGLWIYYTMFYFFLPLLSKPKKRKQPGIRFDSSDLV